MTNENAPHDKPATPRELIDERYGEGEAWPPPEDTQKVPDENGSAPEPTGPSKAQNTNAPPLTPGAQQKLEDLRGANESLRLARRTLKLAGAGAEKDAAVLRLRQAEREALVARTAFYEAVEARSEEP